MQNKGTLAEVIRVLGEQGKYKEQGDTFLKETGTTLTVVEAVPQKLAPWTESHKIAMNVHPINYSVTLKNARKSYTFDFWGSIRDAEMVKRARDVEDMRSASTPEFFAVADYLKKQTGENIRPVWMSLHKLADKVRATVKPGAYNILACMHPMSSDTFGDFCSEYGYDTDSIKAEKTYRAMLEQDRSITRLFSADELEALSEIN